jgi:hypothetical protein
MRIIPLWIKRLLGRVLFVSTRVLLLIVVLTGLDLFTPNAVPAVSAHPSITIAQLVNLDGTLNRAQDLMAPSTWLGGR